MLEKILSLLISFTVIFILCYMCLLTIDLNDLWSALNDYSEIIKQQNKKILQLQILSIKQEGLPI